MISEPNTVFFDNPAMNDYSNASRFCMLRSIIAHLYRKFDRLTFYMRVTTLNVAHLTCNVAKLTCNIAHLTCNVGHLTCNVGQLTLNVAKLTCNVVHLTLNVDHLTMNVGKLTCNVNALTFYLARLYKSKRTQISTLNINDINDALQPFNNALYQYINRNESSNLKIQMYKY